MSNNRANTLKHLNILSAAVLLFLLPIILLYIFDGINIYAFLSKVGLAENALLNQILVLFSTKQVVFALFVISSLLIVFLALSNVYYLNRSQKIAFAQKPDDNFFVDYILKLEKQENKFGYMVSDAWGKPIAMGASFANILRLDKESKESIFDSLLANKELDITNAQLETIFKSLRSKYINQIEVPLKFSLKDSFYRISITPFSNNTCLWSIYFAKGSLLENVNSEYADLLENSPVPLMSFDSKGLLTKYNKAFKKTLGLNKVDKENFKLSKYIENSQPLKLAVNSEEKIKQFNEQVLIDEGLNGKVLINNNNNKSWYWLLQNISKDIEGNVKTIRSALIPEPYTQSQDVKSSAIEKLYNVFSNLEFGFLLVDENYKIVHVNRYGLEYYDIPQGVDVLELFRITEQDIKQSIKDAKKVKSGEGKLLEVKFDDYYFVLSVFSIYDYKGFAIVDCTKSKMLEKELTESEGLQTVGQLASAVAHDFNNLLTAIMGFSDFVKSELTPDAPAYKEIEYIRQNSSRAMVMIRKLLTFSRNRELKPVYLDVNIAITEFNATIGRLIGENIQQQLKRGKNIGRILIDESQFQQIITNLVTNAKHAMAKKGGVLLISTYLKKIDKPISLVRDVINEGTYIVIEVKDQGIGIKKKDLPRLFNSRFSTKGDQGNGFGLYNIYNILRENAGYIDVESKVGVGTSFFIYLPHYDEKNVPQDNPSILDIEEIDLTGTGNILLVEDELPVRMVCVRVLKEKGYNVFEAEDGESALAILEQNKNMDLLISDVVMPGMDGIELVKNSRLINPSLRVIMMSGYEEDVIDKKSTTNIEVEFISKPFTPQMLATKVKNVLSLNVKKEENNINE